MKNKHLTLFDKQEKKQPRVKEETLPVIDGGAEPDYEQKTRDALGKLEKVGRYGLTPEDTRILDEQNLLK